MTDYSILTYAQLRDEVLRNKREIARISVELRHVSISNNKVQEEIDRRANLADDLENVQKDEVRKILKKHKD